MWKLVKGFRKYFIPHEGNDHKPHFFRAKAVMVSLVVLVGIEVLFLTQIFVVFDKTKLLGAVLPAVLTSLTNQDRAENDAPPLVESNLLDKAAQMKADDMATRGYFSHITPDGKDPWYFFDQVGYNYSYAGENLAINFFESKDIAEAWMNSPAHRANIVKKEFTEVGFGVANGIFEGKNTVFVAQFFGTHPSVSTVQVAQNKSIIPQNPVVPKTPVKAEPKLATGVKTVLPATPVETRVLGEATNQGDLTKNYSNTKVFLSRIFTSPREYVNYIFVAFFLFVSIALLLIIIKKSKKNHPMILFRGLSVLCLIFALWFINLNIFGSQTKTPSDSTASVIEALSK